MTTSTLNPCPGEHNLQSLRDFALEAPYDWRKQLEELIELKEAGVEVDDIESDLDSVKDAARGTIKSIKASLADLMKLGEGVTLRREDLDDYEKEVNSAQKDLEDEIDPPQKPVVLEVVK